MRIDPEIEPRAITLVTRRSAVAAVLALTALLALAGACRGSRPSREAAPAQPAGRGEAHAPEAAPEDAAGRHTEEVRLTQAQQKAVGIRVSPAGRGRAGTTVSAPATVVFDPDRVARIGPRVQAKVVRVTADLGERVEAGQAVAVLDSVELGRAKSAYLSAQAALEAAEAHYRRDQPLAEEQIVSQTALQESRARYRQALAERDAAREELRLLGLREEEIDGVGRRDDLPLSRYVLLAPRSGVVQRRDLVPGETVEANETPIHVVDPSVLWVMVDAYEQALPRLALGQPATLRVAVLPGKTFEGEVDWISAALDETTRTVRLRLEVANPEGLLRAGMFGTADVHTGAAGDGELALVPVDALQTIGERRVVFEPAGGKGVFRAVEVTPGAEGGGQVEIRRGLQPGEPVVVAGAFDLMSALTARERGAEHSH